MGSRHRVEKKGSLVGWPAVPSPGVPAEVFLGWLARTGAEWPARGASWRCFLPCRLPERPPPSAPEDNLELPRALRQLLQAFKKHKQPTNDPFFQHDDDPINGDKISVNKTLSYSNVRKV